MACVLELVAGISLAFFCYTLVGTQGGSKTFNKNKVSLHMILLLCFIFFKHHLKTISE